MRLLNKCKPQALALKLAVIPWKLNGTRAKSLSEWKAIKDYDRACERNISVSLVIHFQSRSLHKEFRSQYFRLSRSVQFCHWGHLHFDGRGEERKKFMSRSQFKWRDINISPIAVLFLFSCFRQSEYFPSRHPHRSLECESWSRSANLARLDLKWGFSRNRCALQSGD